MRYVDFLALINGPRPLGIRKGQFAFNSLRLAKPELAEEIRGTNLDPFYEDDRLPQLLDFLATEWRRGARRT